MEAFNGPRYLSSSGSTFDQREQAKEAQSILQGSDAPLRSYRLLNLADLVYEKEFFVGLEKVWAPSFWQHIPTHSRTTRPRCLAFRMLGKSGRIVHESFVRLVDEPRIRLFKLIHNKSLVADIHKIPKCLLCNFAKGFLEAHPGGELAGDDAHHRLVLIVACAHLETVGIEHGHSKTRRKVVG